MTTMAEDLVLLLVDPGSGRSLVDGTSFDRAVGGALLLDLALAEQVTADGAGASARLTVVKGAGTGDPLLDEALGRLAGRPGRAQHAVEKLAKRSRGAVLERLAARGVLARESERALGLFPVARWRTVDPRPREAVLAGVAAVLVKGAEPDARQAGLVSLLHAVRAEHKVVEGSVRQLRARAKEVAEGDWAGAAVRQAVLTVQATVMTAVTASTGGT